MKLPRLSQSAQISAQKNIAKHQGFSKIKEHANVSLSALVLSYFRVGISKACYPSPSKRPAIPLGGPSFCVYDGWGPPIIRGLSTGEETCLKNLNWQQSLQASWHCQRVMRLTLSVQASARPSAASVQQCWAVVLQRALSLVAPRAHSATTSTSADRRVKRNSFYSNIKSGHRWECAGGRCRILAIVRPGCAERLMHRRRRITTKLIHTVGTSALPSRYKSMKKLILGLHAYGQNWARAVSLAPCGRIRHV
jgi:hypothetical protein